MGSKTKTEFLFPVIKGFSPYLNSTTSFPSLSSRKLRPTSYIPQTSHSLSLPLHAIPPALWVLPPSYFCPCPGSPFPLSLYHLRIHCLSPPCCWSPALLPIPWSKLFNTQCCQLSHITDKFGQSRQGNQSPSPEQCHRCQKLNSSSHLLLHGKAVGKREEGQHSKRRREKWMSRGESWQRQILGAHP